MMYCDSCRAEFPDDMTYCKWCGQMLRQRRSAQTTQLSKCYACAAPLQAGWTVCHTCGARQDGAATVSAGPVCMRCGAVVQAGAPNCQRCGERLTVEREAPYAKSGPSKSGPTAPTAIIQRCTTCDEPLDAGVMYCKSCGTPVENSLPPQDTGQPTQSYASFLPEDEPRPSLDRLLSAELPPVAPPADANADPYKETLVVASPFAQPPSAQQRDESAAAINKTEAFINKTEQIAADDNSTFELTPDKVTSPVEGETRPSTRAEIEELLSAGGASDAASEFSIPPEAHIAQPPRQSTDEYATPPTGQDAVLPPDAATEVLTPANWSTEATENFGILTAADLEEDTKTSPSDKTQVYASPFTPPDSNPPPTGAGTQQFSFDSLPFEATTQEWRLPAEPGSTKPSLAEQNLAGQHPADSPTVPSLKPPPAALPVQPPPAPIEMKGQTSKPAKPHSQQAVAQDAPSPFPAPQSAQQKKGSPLAILIPALVLVLAAGGAAAWYFLSGPGATTNTNTSTANTNTANANTNTATANANTATTTPTPPEGMVLVAAGAYTVGRDDGDDIEKPRHTVQLKAFFLDRTEVTNAEYKRFVEATNHEPPPGWVNGNFKAGQANFPVVNVSWADADAYARWAGKRLPTEAEWEAAARGAAASKYPWGNDWRAGLANVGTGGIAEVGKYAAGKSPAGAMDMIGNVWEWTADAFKLYNGSTAQMPEDIEPGVSYRVIRGGAFDGSPQIDASYRGFFDETRRDLSKTGFRCAKDI